MTREAGQVKAGGGGVDLEQLLKLRVCVARFGEMDVASWWNTRGQLGTLGATTLRRGFPRTHRFAQARSVFAVAAHRCDEIFNPPESATLWRLPAGIEEAFDVRWEFWLDHATEWQDFFERVQCVKADADLAEVLGHEGLIDSADRDALKGLRRTADDRALPLPGTFSGTDADIRALALGFSRGEKQAPTIPYLRLA